MGKSSAQTVCIDVDGTLAEYDKWRGVEHIGKPLKGAVAFTHELGKHYRVAIWTTRCNVDVNRHAVPHGHDPEVYLKDLVKAWLDKHGFYYDDILMGKPIAAAFVDDRAVNCMPQVSVTDEYRLALRNIKLVPNNYMANASPYSTKPNVGEIDESTDLEMSDILGDDDED